MPVFELQAGGDVFEVDAPSEAAAMAAFQRMNAPAPPAAPEPQVERAGSVGEAFQKLWENPPSGPSIVGMLKGLVTTPTRAMENLQEVQRTAPPAEGGTWTEEDQFLHDLAQGNLGKSAFEVAAFGPMSRAVAPVARAAAEVAPALPKPAQVVNPAVEAATAIDVPLPRVLATESVPVQRMGSAISQAPMVGEPLIRATRETMEGLGSAATRVERELGAGSAETAGAAAKRDIASWLKKTSRDEEGAAHEAVKGMITPNVITPLRNTAETLAGINAKRANAALDESPLGKFLEDALNRPGLNYEGMKDLRTAFGPKNTQSLIARGMDVGEVKKIYGSLSKDLEQAVLRSGGTRALEAWKRANAESVRIIGEQKRLANIVGVKGDVTAEKVLERLSAMASSSQRADITGLLLAKKAMGQEAWNEVASSIVAKMGRDAQGNFSPERFLGPNGYSRLSENAKTALFSKEHRKALDDIATVSNAIKDKVSQFENRSRTGGTVIGAAGLSGLLIEPMTTIASAIGGNLLARYLAQPVTAKAVAQAVKAQEQAITKPSPAMRMLADMTLRSLIMMGNPQSQQGDNPLRITVTPADRPR